MRGRIRAVLLLAAVVAGGAARAEQVLGTQDGVTILLPGDFTCAESLRLELRADDPGPFADEALMARVAGQLSALMSFDCPEARNILMEGSVGGEPIYSAVTSERSGWSVMTRLAPDAGLAAGEASGGGAASPIPDAGGDGDPSKAAAPGTVSAAVRPAAERGATNAGDPEDFCEAGDFDTRPFARGRELSLLFDGDFETLEESDQRLLTVYLVNLNNNFGRVALLDPACSQFYDPDLAPDLHQSIMGQVMGRPDATAQAGLEILGQIGEMARNPGGFMNQVAEVERAMNAAEADVNRLRAANACTDPGFRRLHENLVSYVSGADPVCASGWPGVRISCAKHALSNGGTAGEARALCGCVTEALRSRGASREVAEGIRTSYDPATSLEPLLAGDAAMRRQVGLCLLR